VNASVMIVCKCDFGHEVDMFPEQCVVEREDKLSSDWNMFVEWKCPRCPGADGAVVYSIEL